MHVLMSSRRSSKYYGMKWKDGRAVFNIAGNKYRVVVWINYPYRVVYIRFIGSHRMYDAIDAQSI